MTQYTNNGSYSSVPSAASSILTNKISPLDSFIMFQTAENEYTALVDPFCGDNYKLIVYRSGNYSSAWNVQKVEAPEETYTYSNEYYTISNIGVGQRLTVDYSALIVVVLCVACTFSFFKSFLRR